MSILYKNKIEAIVNKTLTIAATSGNITDNKAAILSKLQGLSGYPTSLITQSLNLSIIIEDSSTVLSHITENTFTISLNSMIGTDQTITSFKVLRTKTAAELATENDSKKVKIIKDKIGAIATELKTLTIVKTATGRMDSADNKRLIKTALTGLAGYPTAAELTGIIIDIKVNPNNISTIGQDIIFTIKTSNTSPFELSGFKVKRTMTDVEYVASVKKILDDYSEKLIKIKHGVGKVGSSGVSDKISSKIIDKIFIKENLFIGPIITIEKDSADADILETGNGIGFKIIIQKGSARAVITNWKVRRKTTVELENESTFKVKKLFDNKPNKLVSIISLTNISAGSNMSKPNKRLVANNIKNILTSLELNGVEIIFSGSSIQGGTIDRTKKAMSFYIVKPEEEYALVSGWKINRVDS